jgi:resolvase-like protein
MPTPEQKKKLLKAKIAVTLHAELGRVPKKEEIEQAFLLPECSIKQSWDFTTNDRSRRKPNNWQSSENYANWLRRVSTYDQTLHLQQDVLTKAGCNKIFTDTASGAKAERKGLAETLSYI